MIINLATETTQTMSKARLSLRIENKHTLSLSLTLYMYSCFVTDMYVFKDYDRLNVPVALKIALTHYTFCMSSFTNLTILPYNSLCKTIAKIFNQLAAHSVDFYTKSDNLDNNGNIVTIGL